MTSRKRLTVGLAGFGLAGRYLHSPLIKAAGLHVTHVQTSRHDELAEVWPEAHAATEFAHLLSAKPDLIVIATPSRFHFEQAKSALACGIAVVVDKPMALSAADCETLRDLSESTGTPLTVFQNRRWDSDFLALKQALDTNAIGKPVRLVSAWHRHRAEIRDRWREQPGPDAGVFFDLGAHLIDQALCLFGTPDWLQADIFSVRDPSPDAVDDSFQLTLGYPALRVELSSHSLAAGPAREIRLDGTAASLVIQGFDAQETQLRAGLSASDAKFGDANGHLSAELYQPDGMSSVYDVPQGRWRDFYDGVRACLLSGTDMPVAPDRPRTSARLMELARESSASCRRIIL